MAVVSNPQAIAFCNQQIRPMADIMSQLYFTAKSIVAHWNANSMSTIILNNADTMADGAATDGRQILTGVNATAVITEALAVIAHYEATSNAVLNQVKVVAVNGPAKF